MNATENLVVALLFLLFLSAVVFQIISHNPTISKYLSDSITSKDDFLSRSLPSSPTSPASPATEESFLEMADSGTSSCASTNDSFRPTRLSSPSGNHEIRLQIWAETERRHREDEFDKEAEEKLKMSEHGQSSPKMPLMSSPRLPLRYSPTASPTFNQFVDYKSMKLLLIPVLPLVFWHSEQDYTIFYHPPVIKLIPPMVKTIKAKPQKNGEEVGDWAWYHELKRYFV
ncbi:predicted protein [Arabidopsis lyrata subsp. lyrata]|uniref:Predicted protein n=1 Tax=Arabidopsis lyrata subsp. lyrata TaxID=81972 RepID=D7KYR0_ARALL|nr:predicted protein [Arabidopsis lyrata subsp. lyrata]